MLLDCLDDQAQCEAQGGFLVRYIFTVYQGISVNFHLSEVGGRD